MSTMTSVILDREFVAEIRRIEQATGRHGLLAGCVSKLSCSCRSLVVLEWSWAGCYECSRMASILY